jgi:coenzyme F420-0:L-glutamate ligase/coenzyme F420-1:gamma-L-glutamate ligase
VGEIRVHAPDEVPEVSAGDDLVALLLAAADLADGDIVAVTSKVVSKAEGRVRAGTREDALAGETRRLVARRGSTSIVRTHHGLTLAAAGIDASNVESGRVVLLPEDPDASARSIRDGVRVRAGRNVAVVVTDTAGRAWREGQTDIAIGAAGLRVLETYAGRTDAHGNELAVTAPAVADELAGVAELAQGKLGARPFAVVRGRPDLVLPPGDDGPGASALVRPDGADMFGYGSREAVLAALRGDPADIAPFGAPVPAAELAAVLAALPGAGTPEVVGDTVICTPAPDARSAVVTAAFAYGWVTIDPDGAAEVRFQPVTP